MKRIIICCDGTWYSSDKGGENLPSNVARISRMIARHGQNEQTGEKVEQIVYYQTGVGTGQMTKINSIWQGATGAGLEENVTTAYHFIATNYASAAENDDGVADEIFLFGFSRGAYTARALAGMVTELGLLRPHHLKKFGRLYQVYRAHGNDRKEAGGGGTFWACAKDRAAGISTELEAKIKKWQANPTKFMHRGVRIKAIGVWDTVGSRGLPDSLFTAVTGWNKSFQFHDTALNDQIENAFHALSLDEHRGAFQPTLWHFDPHYGTQTHLKQCWFPGYHADTGGGTTDSASKDESDIDEICLAWMCDQVDGMLQFDAAACRKILPPKKSTKTKWAHGRIRDPIGWYRWNMAGGDVARTPGQYDKKLANAKLARRDDDFQTNETVHPSVRARMDRHPDGHAKKYSPPAFQAHTGWRNKMGPAWEFVDAGDGSGARWKRPAVPEAKAGWVAAKVDFEREVVLEEWRIRELPGRQNFEWSLLPSELKEKFEKRSQDPTKQGQFPYITRDELATRNGDLDTKRVDSVTSSP